MNITTGCIIECPLLVQYATAYVPLKVLVVKEEYLKGEKNNTYHHFEVKIIEHLSDHRYNKDFPIGEIIQARAGDLYNGRIVSYPDNYEDLVAEKEMRKNILNQAFCPDIS